MPSICKNDIQVQVFTIAADIITTILYLEPEYWDAVQLKKDAMEWRRLQELNFKLLSVEYAGTKAGRA